MYPGRSLWMSVTSFRREYKGSLRLMVNSFQSSSPPSNIAKAPKTFTGVTEPSSRLVELISRASRGSLLRSGEGWHQLSNLLVPIDMKMRMALVGVLPGLRQATIIPINGPRVLSRLVIFGVLSQRVALFLGGDLELLSAEARNLRVWMSQPEGKGHTSVIKLKSFPFLNGMSCQGEISRPSSLYR
jgi:hypothetical protein